MTEPTRLQLVRADRAADARARIYGHEIAALIHVAKACELDVVPIDALQEIVDRMLDGYTTAASRTSLTGVRGWPQEVKE